MAFIASPRKTLGKVPKKRTEREKAISIMFRKTGRPGKNGRT